MTTKPTALNLLAYLASNGRQPTDVIAAAFGCGPSDVSYVLLPERQKGFVYTHAKASANDYAVWQITFAGLAAVNQAVEKSIDAAHDANDLYRQLQAFCPTYNGDPRDKLRMLHVDQPAVAAAMRWALEQAAALKLGLKTAELQNIVGCLIEVLYGPTSRDTVVGLIGNVMGASPSWLNSEGEAGNKTWLFNPGSDRLPNGVLSRAAEFTNFGSYLANKVAQRAAETVKLPVRRAPTVHKAYMVVSNDTELSSWSRRSEAEKAAEVYLRRHTENGPHTVEVQAVRTETTRTVVSVLRTEKVTHVNIQKEEV